MLTDSYGRIIFRNDHRTSGSSGVSKTGSGKQTSAAGKGEYADDVILWFTAGDRGVL